MGQNTSVRSKLKAAMLLSSLALFALGPLFADDPLPGRDASVPEWGLKEDRGIAVRLQTNVFPYEDDCDEPGCRRMNHAPSVERLTDGSLISVWFSGLSEGGEDSHLLMSTSSDAGITWAAATTIFDPPGSENARNGALFRVGDRLVSLFTVAPVSGGGSKVPSIDMWMIESYDDGRSWTGARKVDVGKDRTYAPLTDPILLADGRFVFAFYWRDFGESQTHAGIIIADNTLTTFEARGDVFIPRRAALEPALTVEPDGTWSLWLRTDLSQLYRARSSDGGYTWTAPAPTAIPSPDSFSDIAPLADGRYVAAWNRHPSRRDYLTIGIFSDGRLNRLQYMQTVRRGANVNESVMYPNVLVSGDGIHVVYALMNSTEERRRSDIWYVRVDVPPPAVDYHFGTASSAGDAHTLNSIFFVDNGRGWAAGQFGTVLRTTDSGKEWTQTPTGTEAHLRAISFSDDLNGVVAGDGGLILTTHDGGSTWTQRLSVGDTLMALHFDEVWYGVTDRGRVFRSENGGRSWTGVATLGSAPLHAIAQSDNRLWAVGTSGRVYTAPRRSGAWERWSLPSEEDLFSVSCSGTMVLVAADHGQLVVSFDEGMQWATRQLPTDDRIVAAACADEKQCMVATDAGRVYRAADVDLRMWIEERQHLFSVYLSGAATSRHAFLAGWAGEIRRLSFARRRSVLH